ncbi:MAG: Coenzyme F420 hydrogenase/dehydrogenase, beta subunit C-terminal domain [Candidatus Jordarchaeum sp.]|uniref:Coenzyme F420 hydrogenase/dehydrogenase, beta subunit C-terminal domain n=1 Tax=Candidatus Jordarchaeum sp. TaxID=2823881 RepID=UPI0040491EA9
MRFRNVADITKWRLCVGCGACVSVCPEGFIRLVNKEDEGQRPVVRSGNCGLCDKCLSICPGWQISKNVNKENGDHIFLMLPEWGQIKEVWEGYAADEELRYFGSSGGAASAIALYCLEKGEVKQVLHSGVDAENPLYNLPVVSKTRIDLLERTGSRYAPSSPCEGLSEIINFRGCSLFIGKPCDIQGVRKAEMIIPEIKEKVNLKVSIFCAGTPSTLATLKLIESLNVPIDRISGVRYRGRGWPGSFAVWTDGSEKPMIEIPYAEAWGFLQKYRPYRCYLCPDGTGELADISCGDPWYRKIGNRENGYSLILIRTERGKEIFYKAMKEKYIIAEKVDPNVLPLSQPGFITKKGAVWGRIFALRAMGIPAPQYPGWNLFRLWLRIPVKEKVRSVFGTVSRAITRKYFKPIKGYLVSLINLAYLVYLGSLVYLG